MLPKKNRANKKAIDQVFKKSIFIGSKNLNFKYYLDNVHVPPQISFIVPKTVEKRAVRRNYLRRCGYLILEKYFKKIPNGLIGVFIFNKTKEENLQSVIEENIKTILNKI